MWLPYVAVDNARKTVERARKNGAQIIIEYQEVMSMGAFAIFVDPTGAVLGIWQSFGPMPGDKPAAKKKAARKKAAPKAAKKARTAPVSSRRKKPAGRKARR
jgi:hypothetical protein